VKPPRADIAAPPLPPATEWVGGAEPRLERLVATGPLLVHFFDLAQLNCARAMPYVEGWSERYAESGLSVLGVHSARYGFTDRADLVAASLPGLGIEWPVAVDSRHAIWRSYGCRGWPSLFLWGRGGALRWYHLGEGDYEATELAIREELSGSGSEGPWPETLPPLRAGDEAGARVMPPTAELLPGGSPERPWAGGPLEVPYEAGGAFLAAGGAGEVAVRLDGEPRDPVAIDRPGLHPVAVHERHERHRLELEPGPGVEIYSVQFAPAPA
jgi:hypothetical protein